MMSLIYLAELNLLKFSKNQNDSSKYDSVGYSKLMAGPGRVVNPHIKIQMINYILVFLYLVDFAPFIIDSI